MARKNSHVTVEATATSTAASSSFGVHTIIYITNDGSVDITFNIDAAPTAANAFTLKPGETLNDIHRECSQLHYKTASSTAAFRAFGLH